MTLSSEKTSPAASIGADRVSGMIGLDRVFRLAMKLILPLITILVLWYAAIYWSGMPAFVIPRPEAVVVALVQSFPLIMEHLGYTMQVAVIGFILANVVGIGLAVLFVVLPLGRTLVMPAAITIRNIPWVILVSVLGLSMGDGMATKVTVVVLASFFPVLVNTYRGLLSVDPILLDRMRILDASLWEVFTKVRFPYSLPYIVAAQEITASASIVIAIAVEWMISRTGLGYLINQSMMQYRGDQVYAVAAVAAVISIAAYSLVVYLGDKLNWKDNTEKNR
jgi:NitT/TauT family transport system permease protein